MHPSSCSGIEMLRWNYMNFIGENAAEGRRQEEQKWSGSTSCWDVGQRSVKRWREREDWRRKGHSQQHNSAGVTSGGESQSEDPLEESCTEQGGLGSSPLWRLVIEGRVARA